MTLSDRIKSHPFFKGMPDRHLAMLSEGASEKIFETGDLLCDEGQPANAFFLIEKGTVTLEVHEPADGTLEIAKAHAGDALGWSWLFQPFTWHLRARALEPTSVITLSGAHLLALAESDHDFGYELMKRVAQLLVQRLMAARKQMLQGQIMDALHE